MTAVASGSGAGGWWGAGVKLHVGEESGFAALKTVDPRDVVKRGTWDKEKEKEKEADRDGKMEVDEDVDVDEDMEEKEVGVEKDKELKMEQDIAMAMDQEVGLELRTTESSDVEEILKDYQELQLEFEQVERAQQLEPEPEAPAEINENRPEQQAYLGDGDITPHRGQGDEETVGSESPRSQRTITEETELPFLYTGGNILTPTQAEQATTLAESAGDTEEQHRRKEREEEDDMEKRFLALASGLRQQRQQGEEEGTSNQDGHGSAMDGLIMGGRAQATDELKERFKRVFEGRYVAGSSTGAVVGGSEADVGIERNEDEPDLSVICPPCLLQSLFSFNLLLAYISYFRSRN